MPNGLAVIGNEYSFWHAPPVGDTPQWRAPMQGTVLLIKQIANTVLSVSGGFEVFSNEVIS